MAARARTTKEAPEAANTPEDDAPSFSTKQPKAVAFDGPVLACVDGVAYRMRTDRSFGASLRYLRAVRKGAVRDAEMELIDHVAGPVATEKLIRAADLDAAAWIGVVKRAAAHVFGRDPEDEEGN